MYWKVVWLAHTSGVLASVKQYAVAPAEGPLVVRAQGGVSHFAKALDLGYLTQATVTSGT